MRPARPRQRHRGLLLPQPDQNRESLAVRTQVVDLDGRPLPFSSISSEAGNAIALFFGLAPQEVDNEVEASYAPAVDAAAADGSRRGGRGGGSAGATGGLGGAGVTVDESGFQIGHFWLALIVVAAAVVGGCAACLIGRCVLKLCKGGRRAQTTDKGAVASRTADGEFLAGVGKRGNLAPAHGLPSPHKYDDAVRV